MIEGLKQLFVSERGKDLDAVLKSADYQTKLFNTRIFYIVSSNLDPDIKKIGVSSGGEGNTSMNRLKDYQITYGFNDKQNRYKGAKVHYVGYTRYVRPSDI